jgi:AcrR family transcriptional regulator
MVGTDRKMQKWSQPIERRPTWRGSEALVNHVESALAGLRCTNGYADRPPVTTQAGSGARGTRSRVPLSRERVLRAAVRVADESGIEAVTMRRLADELGAEAMSLYYHVANKEDILDGVVDVVATEINDVVDGLARPVTGAAWKAAARQRILAARQILLRHPWAPAVFETRSTVSPGILRYYDGLLGLMRDGGFTYDQAHHALHALGSKALGFSQELFTPAAGAGDNPDPAAMEAMAAMYPHLAGMMADIVHDDPDSTLGWCDDQAEFEFGLDLLLDGLERIRERAPRVRSEEK